MSELPAFRFQAKGKKLNRDRYALLNEFKIELINGELFGTEKEQLIMLGLLVENLGTDKVQAFIEKYSK